MKKIFLLISMTIIIVIYTAPSFVKADIENYIGQVVLYDGHNYHIVDTYIKSNITPEWFGYSDGYFYVTYYGSYYLYYHSWIDDMEMLVPTSAISGYFSFLYTNYSWNIGFTDGPRYFYNTYEEFMENLPPELLPQPSVWDDFYEYYYREFGYYPRSDSIIGLLRRLFDGDYTENTIITFPTYAPTPTPTPTPTPIPVQTIFVPDGNGNTTIIYQYPDPNTGVITQSPYNPNISNNIEVICNHNDDNSNDIFSIDPQDPYTITAPLLWADGFGVEISDNPLTSVNESQQTLAEAATDYQDSVYIVSNSFNILPIKWLTFVGLLGGILIIAGLIRTFLGG